jgi:DNA-binding MarR family transcriptional regulator
MKHELLFSLYLFGRRVRQMVTPDHSDKMLTGAILWLLNKKKRTVSELATELCTQSSSISEKLTQLEKEGIIERKTSEVDKRSQIILITKKGSAFLSEMLTSMDHTCVSALESFDMVELTTFRKLLTKLMRQ